MYRVKCYYYLVKWCNCVACYWCVALNIVLISDLMITDSVYVFHSVCFIALQNGVFPNPRTSCGPYKPIGIRGDRQRVRYDENVSKNHHDTVGVLVIDRHGNIAAGTSTNGANHKIPG